jgi:predicted phage tail protein
LVAFSLLLPGVGAAIGGAAMTKIGLIGGALILGGIAQLLTPVPKIGGAEDDPRKSYSFSGVQNVSRQGVPVPIVYGEMIVGSIVISAGISTDKVEVAA